jgi:Uma2 family endonuclease
MLINGVILEQGLMNPPHANAIEMTNDAIRSVFGKGWRVRVQLPLELGAGTDPMPDFAILPGTPQTSADHPKTASLVIEVADSSLKYDTTEKAALYATAWIPEYWVIDTDSRRLLVHRDPVATPDGPRYATVTTLKPADVVTPLAASGATIKVADLVP